MKLIETRVLMSEYAAIAEKKMISSTSPHEIFTFSIAAFPSEDILWQGIPISTLKVFKSW